MMTHQLSNQYNKAVGNAHAAPELIVAAPYRLEVRFGLKICSLGAASYVGEGEGRTQAVHTLPDNITSTISSLAESLCTFSGVSPGLSRLNVV